MFLYVNMNEVVENEKSLSMRNQSYSIICKIEVLEQLLQFILYQ